LLLAHANGSIFLRALLFALLVLRLGFLLPLHDRPLPGQAASSSLTNLCSSPPAPPTTFGDEDLGLDFFSPWPAASASPHSLLSFQQPVLQDVFLALALLYLLSVPWVALPSKTLWTPSLFSCAAWSPFPSDPGCVFLALPVACALLNFAQMHLGEC
jgi:hypothetical protein